MVKVNRLFLIELSLNQILNLFVALTKLAIKKKNTILTFAIFNKRFYAQ